MNRIQTMLAVLALAPVLATAQGSQGTKEPPKSPAKGTTPMAAAEAPATSGAPPAARDLARALTTQEAWNGIIDGYATSLAGQISGALAATGKEAPADLREKVRGELHEAVRYEQAVDMQARALAGRFSADELRALETFYRTGAGKKLLEVLPEVARQVNDELRARLSERVPRIVERYAPSVAAAPPDAAGKDAAPDAAGKGTPKTQGRTPPKGEAVPPRR
jgi:hypothetical protein